MRLKSPLPLNMAALETKPSTYEVWGIFKIQTFISRLEGLIDNLDAHSSKCIEKNIRSSPDMSHPKENMPLLANFKVHVAYRCEAVSVLK